LRRWATIAFVLALACRTTTPPPPVPNEILHGTASWYGQEFAGRTTANGEIFDPMQLTAAHRSLPFGTVVDVRNQKNGQIVRVRINDRGPYINDRLIDLSYAAAQRIGLVEPGIGDVELSIVRLGKGDREPPAPYIVSVPEVKPVGPAPAAPAPTVAQVPVVVDSVTVVEEHQGAETRRQVSADGKRIENVPIQPRPPSVAQVATQAPPPEVARHHVVSTGGFVVQVGAFAQENNAKLLMDQLTQLGEKPYIDHTRLYLVRLGPFTTRDEAIRMRTRLENAGLSVQ